MDFQVWLENNNDPLLDAKNKIASIINSIRQWSGNLQPKSIPERQQMASNQRVQDQQTVRSQIDDLVKKGTPKHLAIQQVVAPYLKQKGLSYFDVRSARKSRGSEPYIPGYHGQNEPSPDDIPNWMLNLEDVQNDFLTQKQQELFDVIDNLHKTINQTNQDSMHSAVMKALESSRNAIQNEDQRSTATWGLQEIARKISVYPDYSIYYQPKSGGPVQKIGVNDKGKIYLGHNGEYASDVVGWISHNRILRIRKGQKFLKQTVDLGSEDSISKFLDMMD